VLLELVQLVWGRASRWISSRRRLLRGPLFTLINRRRMMGLSLMLGRGTGRAVPLGRRRGTGGVFAVSGHPLAS
jgi:hypothetical protein